MENMKSMIDKKMVMYISEEMYEWLRRESYETKQSMAEIVRKALDLYIKRKDV